MIRRFREWFWPYLVLILVYLIVHHLVDLWHFLIIHVWQLQQYDMTVQHYWNVANTDLRRLILIFAIILICWYVWDFYRGYSIMDYYSVRLRNYLIRGTRNITDQTIDVNSQDRANKKLRSLKIKRDWKKPHKVTVLIRLSSNQNISSILRERIFGGLGSDDNSVIAWLNRQTGKLIGDRHWSIEQSNRYIIIIGEKD